MSGPIIGVVATGVLLVMILMGIPMAISGFCVGLFGILIVKGFGAAWGGLQGLPFWSVASFNLSVVPLFVFMGALIFESGVADDIFDAIRYWIGHIRGGLAVATAMETSPRGNWISVVAKRMNDMVASPSCEARLRSRRMPISVAPMPRITGV